MNKAALMQAVADEVGESRATTEKVVNAAFELIIAGVADTGRVAIGGFGTFESRPRATRRARNPRTGEPITIEATVVPAFKPSKAFREAVKPLGR